MLIFIDLDGTLFDTYSLNPQNNGEWIYAYASAPLMKGANETISELNNNGDYCIAITQRGVNLGKIVYDISKNAILSRIKPKSNIKGLIWKVDNKTKFIVENHEKINHTIGKHYPFNQIVLIDDDIDTVAQAAQAGFLGILFGAKSTDTTSKLPPNLKIAEDWNEVKTIINTYKCVNRENQI